MRKYLKAWERFRRWLILVGSPSWPTETIRVIEFLQVLLSEPCGATVPQGFLQAAAWMEKTAGFVAADRLSGNPLVIKAVEKVTTLLMSGSRSIKQSPRVPCVIMASVELFLMNWDHPVLLRYAAWVLLIKCWASLRHDDLQHIRPSQVKLLEGALLAVLSQSKTSGPGKRMRELPVVIARGCRLCGTSWLEEGFHLMREIFADSKDVDFLIPRGTPGSMLAPASYSDASATERRLFMALKVPLLTGDMKWYESAEGLTHMDLLGFWALHSPRTYMPSMLIFLDVEKSKRDMVGRWCPSGSEDYTRTYRAAVARMQAQITLSLHDGAGLSTMKDSGVVERLCGFLQERRSYSLDHAEAMVASWATLMTDFHYPLQAAGADIPFKATTVETPLVQKLPLLEEAPVSKDSHSELGGKFLLIFSRARKFARLHRFGACHWSHTEVHDSVRLDLVTPGLYNSRCRFCWPVAKVSESSEDSQEESSDGEPP